jgi:predicted HicB family RNase H-like nuclease
MHKATSTLYEELHNENGEPHKQIDQVLDIVNKYKRWVLIEVDLIREACREHGEEGV